jgi:hypothetical protein
MFGHYQEGKPHRVGTSLVTYVDPVNLHLGFDMDTQNGTDLNSWVKTIVVGGCDSSDVPFLVKQDAVTMERVVDWRARF